MVQKKFTVKGSEVSTHYLFVYGTLIESANKFAVYLRQNSSFYGEGKVPGKLYHVGQYPGATIDTNCAGFVYGQVFIVSNPEKALKTLDDYEGFGEGYDQPNEFIRVLADIETSGELVRCWIYLYNLSTDGLTAIPSGDYRQYKA